MTWSFSFDNIIVLHKKRRFQFFKLLHFQFCFHISNVFQSSFLFLRCKLQRSPCGREIWPRRCQHVCARTSWTKRGTPKTPRRHVKRDASDIRKRLHQDDEHDWRWSIWIVDRWTDQQTSHRDLQEVRQGQQWRTRMPRIHQGMAIPRLEGRWQRNHTSIQWCRYQPLWQDWQTWIRFRDQGQPNGRVELICLVTNWESDEGRKTFEQIFRQKRLKSMFWFVEKKHFFHGKIWFWG